MTIEVKDEFKIKTKRTEHPNASKYPGRVSFEFNQAKFKFMNELNDCDLDKLLSGTLIVDEEMSSAFFDSIQDNDVIGLGLLNGINELNQNIHQEPAAYKFLVLKVDRQRDVLVCRNITWEPKKAGNKVSSYRISALEGYEGTEVEVAFEDVSVGLGMGYAEILERNGELFGCDQEIEYNVKVVGKSDATNESSLKPETVTIPEVKAT